jgi:ceramide glucosyltransferase
MTAIAMILLALCTVWTALGLATVVRTARCAAHKRARERSALPTGQAEAAPLRAVSILKPLCGVDAGLEQNLESFFQQDYPSLELLFGVEDPHDPAIAVVNRLRQRYPGVPCRLVVHQGGRATNPKVRNLLGIVPAASHDLLLLSDSNIRVPRHYVREMVDVMRAEPGVGLVTSLIAGKGETTLGGALECVQLDGFCAAGATLPTSFGDAAVIGKSLLFARSTFERLGGFARVADVLAEDYVMGKMFELGGLRVAVASTVVENVTTGMSLGAFLRRHLRWSMLRIRLRPFTFLLEPLTSPMALLPLALVGLGPWAIAWVVGLCWLRDVGGWLALRGRRRLWIPAALGPLRDLCMLGVWLYTPIEQHVCWRGNRARLGAGTLLFPRVA